MLVRALKTTSGSYGHLPRGKVADVPMIEARELIAHGYATEELPLAEQEAANDNRPLAPTGGQTGADAPQLSSQAVQAQQMQTCPSSRDVGQSEPSQSTTDTSSARGQTFSTPATTIGGKRKRGRTRSKA